MSKQQAEYRKTPKGKEVQKIATAKYQKTPAGRLTSFKANRIYKNNKYWKARENEEFYNEATSLIILI